MSQTITNEEAFKLVRYHMPKVLSLCAGCADYGMESVSVYALICSHLKADVSDNFRELVRQSIAYIYEHTHRPTTVRSIHDYPYTDEEWKQRFAKARTP